MNDKSLEEILGLLQVWPESFFKRFGRKPTKTELINHLSKAYDEAIEKQLKTTFDGFGPQAILTTIDELKQGDFEFIEHDLSYPMEKPVFNILQDQETRHFADSLDSSLTPQPVTQEVVKNPSKNDEPRKKNKHKWMPNF